jgi:hypothetical protein
MAAERKLDIFRVLNATNAKDATFLSNLSEDERKEFQAFLVMRWMSGTYDASQVYLINEFVNPYAFSLTKHKELLWQLMTACNSGKNQRYSWNKLPGKREAGKPNATKAVMQYFGYSVSHAVDAMQILRRSQIIEMAEDMGWQQEDIAKIRREIKASDDPDDKPAKKSKKKAEEAEDLMKF